jgi:hypothetical protein
MKKKLSAMNIAFDTLEYSDKLIAAGFSEKQARVQAQALRDIVVEKVATKADIQAEVALLRKDIEAQGNELRKDIEAQGSELRKDIEAQNRELHSEIALVCRDMRMLLYRLLGSIISTIVIAIGVVSKLAGLFGSYGQRCLQPQSLTQLGVKPGLPAFAVSLQCGYYVRIQANGC